MVVFKRPRSRQNVFSLRWPLAQKNDQRVNYKPCEYEIQTSSVLSVLAWWNVQFWVNSIGILVDWAVFRTFLDFTKMWTRWNFEGIFLKIVHQKGLFDAIKENPNFPSCRTILDIYRQWLLKKEGNLHLFFFLLIRSLSNFQVDFALDLYSYNFLL